MTNSGHYETGTVPETDIRFGLDWSITNINNEAGTGILNWNVYGIGSNIAYIVWGNNWLGVNDILRWSFYGSGNGTRNNPYPMYTGGYESDIFYATLDYYTFEGWAYRIRNITSGSTVIYYNDEGTTSIKFNGEFHCLGTSDYYKVSLDTGYFQPDKIERFNRAQRSGNQGSSWNKNVYFWKTTDSGTNWKRCNGYKTTNGTSSNPTWTKV